MGYEVYSLEGFLLDINPFGEAGLILILLTKEFGIFRVSATGVREIKSKMRGSIQPMSLIKIDYIQGKEMNRLTGIEIIEKYDSILYSFQKRNVISRIVNFLYRIVGEQTSEDLFFSFKEGMDFLNMQIIDKVRILDKEFKFEIFEIIWLVKILINLGYFPNVNYASFELDSFLFVESKEIGIVEKINEAIKSTQL